VELSIEAETTDQNGWSLDLLDPRNEGTSVQLDPIETPAAGDFGNPVKVAKFSPHGGNRRRNIWSGFCSVAHVCEYL